MNKNEAKQHRYIVRVFLDIEHENAKRLLINKSSTALGNRRERCLAKKNIHMQGKPP